MNDQARWGEAQRFLQSVLDGPAVGGGCRLWPYATSAGYAAIQRQGKVVHGHTVICRHFHGDPDASQQVRHLCGERTCIAPWHLAWGTQAENEADKIGHGRSASGERNGRAKLTEADVDQIRLERPGTPIKTLAERYGVSQATISEVANRRHWKGDPT